jgi:hypothetical protein
MVAMTASTPRLRRPWVRIGAYLALSALCSTLFYVRYWQWRDCIAEALSSCITPDGANVIAGGQLWAAPALLFALAALRLGRQH